MEDAGEGRGPLFASSLTFRNFERNAGGTRRLVERFCPSVASIKRRIKSFEDARRARQQAKRAPDCGNPPECRKPGRQNFGAPRQPRLGLGAGNGGNSGITVRTAIPPLAV